MVSSNKPAKVKTERMMKTGSACELRLSNAADNRSSLVCNRKQIL